MPIPSAVHLHRRSQQLELRFGDDVFFLPAEFLRVHSPSAEVRGHGRGQEVLQHGKLKVAITAVEPQGNYAIRLVFDDGHSSGIYSWDYLHQLGSHQAEYWDTYLAKLKKAGKGRDPDESPVRLISPEK